MKFYIFDIHTGLSDKYVRFFLFILIQLFIHNFNKSVNNIKR